MDLLDEFKYQSYKSRIESLTGTKKPLVDLLKELTTKYATDPYTLEPEIYIPLFRARKLNSKEYVIGLLMGIDEESNLCSIREIDSNDIGGEICHYRTLAINFPDMIDSEKNKIFASLSKSGTGGDILTRGKGECGLVCCYKFAKFWFVSFGEKSYENHSSEWTQYAYNKNDYFCTFNKMNIQRDFVRSGLRVIGIKE